MRGPNSRLRFLREQVPLTQAELAERVGVAELTVRRWETEGLRPQLAHVRSLCSALDVTPAELGYGTDDPAPSEPAPDTPLDDPPRLFVLDARTLLAALSGARSAQPSAWLPAPLDPREETVAATHLALMSGSTLGAGPSPEEDVGSTSYTGTQKGSPSAGFRVQEARGNVLMGVADESARFLRDTEASRIGSLTLDQLEADLRWLAHAYLNQPLAELFFPTVQLRNLIFTLLERNRYPEQTRQLYLIAGQTCLLLAKASKDFGSLAAAETHARTAWLCAELADNHDLRAWVRGYQALSAYWDGRPADAVRFVEGGQRFPARGSATLFLPSVHVRAAGLMSDTRAITAALVAGDTAGEQTQPDDLAGGIFLFPAAEQALYASDAYTALGD